MTIGIFSLPHRLPASSGGSPGGPSLSRPSPASTGSTKSAGGGGRFEAQLTHASKSRKTPRRSIYFTLALTERKRRTREGVIVGAVDPKRHFDLVGVVAALLATVIFLSSIPASVALKGSPMRAVSSSTGHPGSARIGIVVKRRLDGAVVESATVRVFWADGDRYYLVGTATTGTDGRAIVAKLPSGAVWVVVEGRGFARRSTA